MTGVAVVVGQRLVHIHVDVKAVQEDGCVLVRHQVPDQPVLRYKTLFGDVGVGLVSQDYFFSSFLVVKRIQYFVESRIALFLVVGTNRWSVG